MFLVTARNTPFRVLGELKGVVALQPEGWGPGWGRKELVKDGVLLGIHPFRVFKPVNK